MEPKGGLDRMSLGDRAIDLPFTVAGHPKGGVYTGEGLAVAARHRADALHKVLQKRKINRDS